MRKAAALAAAVLVLAGCESFGNLTSDAFDPGSATQSRFTLDSAGCRARAANRLDNDIAGIAATHAERHAMFNQVYTNCMQAYGYARRDWSPSIPIPYEIDPTP